MDVKRKILKHKFSEDPINILSVGTVRVAEPDPALHGSSLNRVAGSGSMCSSNDAFLRY